MTFDPMSVEVTCVTLPKDHCVQVPWEYISVCGYSDQFCKLPHTYIHIHTYYVHTTYRMSDHIVSYWTQFRRDKNCVNNNLHFMICKTFKAFLILFNLLYFQCNCIIFYPLNLLLLYDCHSWHRNDDKRLTLILNLVAFFSYTRFAPVKLMQLII